MPEVSIRVDIMSRAILLLSKNAYPSSTRNSSGTQASRPRWTPTYTCMKGRERTPSAAVIDIQAVKGTAARRQRKGRSRDRIRPPGCSGRPYSGPCRASPGLSFRTLGCPESSSDRNMRIIGAESSGPLWSRCSGAVDRRAAVVQ